MSKKDIIDWKNINKIRAHSTRETMKHLLVKAIVTKMLVDKKYMIYTEHNVKRNGKTRVADIYAWKGPDRLIIELESRPTKKHNKELIDFYEDEGDLIIIDLRKISMDMQGIKDQVQEFLPI